VGVGGCEWEGRRDAAACEAGRSKRTERDDATADVGVGVAGAWAGAVAAAGAGAAGVHVGLPTPEVGNDGEPCEECANMAVTGGGADAGVV